MCLESYIEPEVARLKNRLSKEGVDDLACMDYEKYLRTALWKKIKQWILQRDGEQCKVCCRQGTSSSMDIHHRSYDLEVLEGKRDDLLISLCRRCHKKIEFYSNGQKRISLSEKDKEYYRLQKLHEAIRKTGLALSLTAKSSRGITNIEIKYIGNEEYTVFYSIGGLLNSFMLNVISFQKHGLRTPLPYGNRFSQKSGAKLIDIKSNKCVARVMLHDGLALIKISKSCIPPVQELLINEINDSKYWHIAETNI